MTDLPPVHAYEVASLPVFWSDRVGDYLPIHDLPIGTIGVSIGKGDSGGDVPIAFPDGRVEQINWRSLMPAPDEPRANYLTGVMRFCLFWSEDEFAAVEDFAHSVAFRDNLAATAGKTCSKCKEFKVYGVFGVDLSSNDGRAHRCKECERARDAARK